MLYIYILKCEHNKYYIGKTKEPWNRLKSHYNGSGSSWTKKYKPIETLEVIPNCDIFDEDKYTKMYMDKYGIDNVRGGSYCQVYLDSVHKAFIKKEIDSANDKCYKCGFKGHFGRYCSYGKIYNEDKNINNVNNVKKYSSRPILSMNMKYSSRDNSGNNFRNNFITKDPARIKKNSRNIKKGKESNKRRSSC